MPSRSLRGSHLKQVSSTSLDTSTTKNSHLEYLVSNEKTNKLPGKSLSCQPCTLWIHDENFSKEDILFNSAVFSENEVKIDDVIEITPLWGAGDPVNPQFKSESGSRPGHDNHFDVNLDLNARKSSKFASRMQGRCLFVVKPLSADIRQRHPKLEISVTNNVANIFGFKNRSQVLLSVIDRSQCTASHVDISFRDQYLVRSDMWRLVTSELVDRTIYKGQKIVFMGTIKGVVKNIFIREKKALSGYFAPSTIPVFRCESVRYVLFIQMSREMWDFDSEGTGDILFSRVINGFLPELFKRWANIEAKHLVTIVLFTRVEYGVTADQSSSPLSVEAFKRGLEADHISTRDFYRVVVNDMASGQWTAILDELKRNFQTFLRDVSIQKVEHSNNRAVYHEAKAFSSSTAQIATITGRPSSVIRGNILEAIHLATSHLAYDHIDRDMTHTGTSIIIITPGCGLFEVSYESLTSTTEAVTDYGIAIDLICLSPIPLHSVPLFKYPSPRRKSGYSVMGESSSNYLSTDSQPAAVSLSSKFRRLSYTGSGINSFSRPVPREKLSVNPDEWSYGIPHWLEISFWNPETHREGRRISKNDINAPIPFTVTKQSKLFVPRVRMYEIQMMGVMESEQSNISIPYLAESNQGLHQGQGSLPGSNSSILCSRINKLPFSPGSTNKSQLGDSLRPEPFLPRLAMPREVGLSLQHKRQKKILSWMDDYDDHVFQPFLNGKNSKRTPKIKKLGEADIPIGQFQDRLLTKSTASLKEREDSSASARRRPTKKEPDSSLHPVKGPALRKDVSPRKPAMKITSIARTSRISRKISFALRGLISEAPRAQPSTEINAEHASALPILAKGTSVGPLSDVGSVKPTNPSRDDTTSALGIIDRLPTSMGSVDNLELHQSRPISIKAANKKVMEDLRAESRCVDSSFSATTGMGFDQANHPESRGPFPMERTGPKFDVTLKAGLRDVPIIQEPSAALGPWIRTINPSNTPKATLRRDVSWFGRWQHAYPRPPHVAVVKWKSLKSPAVLPLTTEEFPTSHELAGNYLQTPYRVFPNDDHEGSEVPKTRDAVLREMIALRLARGFQIVVGNAVAEVSGQYALESLNVFDHRGLGKDGATVFLSMGNTIHRLVCVAGGEIEVTKFTRRAPPNSLFDDKRVMPTAYTAAIRTILAEDYEPVNIRLKSSIEEYNWNYADSYIAGHRDHLINPMKQLRFWLVRYVLIPMRLPANSRLNSHPFNEDNEEEIHLLGIKQLTHMWQRHRYVPSEEKRFRSSALRIKDENPLNIIYQTRNPSEIVAAELDRILLTDPGLDNPPAQLLPDSELLERTNINLSSLAQMIQGDKGIRMMDRRWHWRLHYNCFIGSEFVTWMLQNFRDIDTREEAVEFGNELMKHDLFQHVQQRHNFRDGNYFYQIASEYRVSRPESRVGWFPVRKAEKSVPSTPIWEGAKDSPVGDSEKPEGTDELATLGLHMPSKLKTKVAILLSKSIKYDVDPRKRSNRLEIVDLHYDRLHNPDNCFHIALTWMSATPKFIEDAVVSWTLIAEKFGLRLVQVPVAEASAITETHPFRRPQLMKLKVEPPKGPITLSFTATSFSQPGKPEKHYFQKAILKKFDFVLDFEAGSAFPSDVEVSYSWRKPDYRYPQYIHRSGTLLAEITDEGDFLLLANRLFNMKGIVGRDNAKFDRASERPDQYRPRAATYDPMNSPRFSPESAAAYYCSPHAHTTDSVTFSRTLEHVKQQFEEFCNDATRLEQFYLETQMRPASTKVGPAAMSSVMESSIPSLELPASLVGHHHHPHHHYQHQHHPRQQHSLNPMSLPLPGLGLESCPTDVVVAAAGTITQPQESTGSNHSVKSSPQSSAGVAGKGGSSGDLGSGL